MLFFFFVKKGPIDPCVNGSEEKLINAFKISLIQISCYFYSELVEKRNKYLSHNENASYQ